MDERIVEHLKLLSQYILYLRELAGVDEKEVLHDFRVRGSAERYLQLAIESCINIGNRVLSLLQLQQPVRTPETYADIFVELGRLEVIPAAFVNSMVKMVRFHSRLVHMYWDVDPVQLCRILRENLTDLDRFRDCMVAYLQREAPAN